MVSVQYPITMLFRPHVFLFFLESLYQGIKMFALSLKKIVVVFTGGGEEGAIIVERFF